MSAKDEITAAAFDLVKAMIKGNAEKYETEIGPVMDQGSGQEHGTWRVKVERVEG